MNLGADNAGIDFASLGEWCKSRPGHVQVCEAEPADWLPFEPHVTMKNQNGDMKTELIWYSDPPLRLFEPPTVTPNQ